MTKFAPFEEIYEPLILPINGKEYTLPAVLASEGDRFTSAVAGTEDAFFSDEDLELMLLGADLKKQMVDDGVSDAALKRVLLTALADYQGGRKSAEMMWATGGDSDAMAAWVKAHAPNRAARRAKTKSA
jgi:hypothetical protein